MRPPAQQAYAAVAEPEVRSFAEPTDLQQYLQLAQSRAEILLQAHNIDPEAQAVAVRASVSDTGRLLGLQLLRSCGVPSVDRTVGHVLRKVVLADAPTELMGGSITLSLGLAPVLLAEVP